MSFVAAAHPLSFEVGVGDTDKYCVRDYLATGIRQAFRLMGRCPLTWRVIEAVASRRQTVVPSCAGSTDMLSNWARHQQRTEFLILTTKGRLTSRTAVELVRCFTFTHLEWIKTAACEAVMARSLGKCLSWSENVQIVKNISIYFLHLIVCNI